MEIGKGGAKYEEMVKLLNRAMTDKTGAVSKELQKDLQTIANTDGDNNSISEKDAEKIKEYIEDKKLILSNGNGKDNEFFKQIKEYGISTSYKDAGLEKQYNELGKNKYNDMMTQMNNSLQARGNILTPELQTTIQSVDTNKDGKLSDNEMIDFLNNNQDLSLSDIYDTVQDNTVLNLENMSPEELKQAQLDAKTNVSEAQTALDDIYSGKNSGVASANQQVLTAKDNYEKLLDQEQSLSNDQKQQLLDADKKVQDCKDEVSEAERTVQDLDNDLTNLKNEITKNNTSISELGSKLSSLSGMSSDDDDEQSKINERKSLTQTQYNNANTALKRNKEKLEGLRQQKKQAEDDLQNKKDALAQAEQDRAALEQQFLNNGNISQGLQTALQTYRDAETNADTIKSEEAQNVQKQLDNYQANLQTINNQIIIKEVEAI